MKTFLILLLTLPCLACTLPDKYYQIKRVSDSKNKGTGLGLAIVKKILDLHEFEIIVDSDLNKGTSFNIIINCTVACSEAILKNKDFKQFLI